MFHIQCVSFGEIRVWQDLMKLGYRSPFMLLAHLFTCLLLVPASEHWHVYRKWNARLFREMYIAYKKNRMEKNPLEFWYVLVAPKMLLRLVAKFFSDPSMHLNILFNRYAGEIGFFDFYIIPLAKKLKDCGVFGVSCDEYLNYAQANRDQWVQAGEEVVKELEKSAAEIDKAFERSRTITKGYVDAEQEE